LRRGTGYACTVGLPCYGSEVASANGPTPAATVLVLRDGPAGPEVFMVRRREGTSSFSGAHVFPGGRVDESDAGAADAGWCDGVHHATRQLGDLSPGEAVAYHMAAVRELFEEAGVLLARDRSGAFVALASAGDHDRFKHYRLDVHAHRRTLRDIVEHEGLRLALDALILHAHWVTPSIDGARRFDTRFFVTRVPPFQTPAHDETETTGSSWITAAAAIDAAERCDIVLPPPTWTTLREVERFRTVDEVVMWSRLRLVRRREPELFQQDGTRVLLMPGEPRHSGGAEERRPSETRFVWADGRWRPERASAAGLSPGKGIER
jgi:8-oxo-dGTP pyrophosphatase MutT (NUDIX family)